jgi:hypothetical protein
MCLSIYAMREVNLAALGAHFPRFEEVNRLSQHFPEVAPIDLINY